MSKSCKKNDIANIKVQKTHNKLCVKRVTAVWGKGGGNVARGEGGVGCRGWRVVGVDGQEVGCGSRLVVVLFRGNVFLVREEEEAGSDEQGCGVR
jgi:hypothetical protein